VSHHLLPQATVTMPGLCHNLDIQGDPHASPVTHLPDGTPRVPLDLGEVLGRHTVVHVSDPAYLLSLVDAALFAHSLLTMAYQDQPGRAA